MFAMVSHTDALWLNALALGTILVGLVTIWRGLNGGRERARGLLLHNISMVERMEGFRLLVFGLVLLGLGSAVIWQAEWLFYMALGIGFVEILESSTLIAVWQWGSRRHRVAR